MQQDGDQMADSLTFAVNGLKKVRISQKYVELYRVIQGSDKFLEVRKGKDGAEIKTNDFIEVVKEDSIFESVVVAPKQLSRQKGELKSKGNKLIVLVGAMGVGKSALINCLCGSQKAKSGSDPGGVTKNVKSYKCRLGGFEVDLVDTPGLGDEHCSFKSIIVNIFKEVQRDPIDMVIFVMNGAIERISRWELAYLKMIETLFNCSQQRKFVCFTHMDMTLKKEQDQVDYGKKTIAAFNKRIVGSLSLQNGIYTSNRDPTGVQSMFLARLMALETCKKEAFLNVNPSLKKIEKIFEGLF